MDRVKRTVADMQRKLNALSRPTGETNARRLREHGESLDSIVFRDAVAADIPALAELHVTTWNATYNTTQGPTIATRTWQWNKVFGTINRRDFVLVLEDRNGRLIGFTWGKFAELNNPTLGFYDRMGGERLLNDRGLFDGAYGWRDVRLLLR